VSLLFARPRHASRAALKRSGAVHIFGWCPSTSVMDKWATIGTIYSSVANHRKQESWSAQVVDFSTHHFQILPPKDNFVTEPCSRCTPTSCCRMPAYASPCWFMSQPRAMVQRSSGGRVRRRWRRDCPITCGPWKRCRSFGCRRGHSRRRSDKRCRLTIIV